MNGIELWQESLCLGLIGVSCVSDFRKNSISGSGGNKRVDQELQLLIYSATFRLVSCFWLFSVFLYHRVVNIATKLEGEKERVRTYSCGS